MDFTYKLKEHANEPSLKYFSDNPISEWSFAQFNASINRNKSRPTSEAKIKNAYLSAMNNIQNYSDVPDFVKTEARRLSSVLNTPEEKPKNINYTITAVDSSVFAFNTSSTFTVNSNQLPQSTETAKHQEEKEVEKEADPDPTPNLEHSYNEEIEEDKIPSDLSIDHHPLRTCDYSLTFTNLDEENEEKEDEEEEEEEEENEENPDEVENTTDVSEWIVNNTCISDLCFTLKNVTSQFAKRSDPAQLSDIRLLVLNDIYKFDRNFASSVTKYFSSQVRTLLKPSLSFDAYLPSKGLNCYDWCMQIEMSPPADWVSSITLCTELLNKACESKNRLDMHTAHVLIQILPVLINGPPDDSNEDSYVHYYLSPLLSSVFASDPLLKIKWANSQLTKSNRNDSKPDFLVFNLSGSVKCIILIAEFKPTEQNSYVESDLVKLAKQMKETLNALIVKGVKKPKVCGIHCEGENVQTYVMDIPAPKLYRLTNASNIKLFKNLDQISLLPNVITHLLCLKGIAVETATKIEAASLYTFEKLKRPAPNPPVDWLSNENAVLSRTPKKQKK